jgi:hypothetical protein
MYSASPSLDPICAAIEFSMVWELGIGYREWEEASTLYQECATVTTIEDHIAISQKFGDAYWQMLTGGAFRGTKHTQAVASHVTTCCNYETVE